jgi:integrase
MAPRQTRRNHWRQTKTGTWTCTLGQRGSYVVRLFQNRRGGCFYRDVHSPDNTRSRLTLGTTDRAEADQMGCQLYAALLAGVSDAGPPRPHTVALGDVCERFLRECPMFLDNDPRGHNDTQHRLDLMRSAIGEDRDVRTLTVSDVRQYEARRKKGGISYGEGKLSGSVRQRSVQADVKLLKHVLSWACTVTVAGGTPWLERNPLAGIVVKGEPDVHRPVASVERYQATRAAMAAFQNRYADEGARTNSRKERVRAESRYRSWVRAELGLTLLEATGRRRGAIMGLRWDDIDFAARKITWRAEFDKKGRTSIIAYPKELLETIRQTRHRLGAVGGYVFPRQDDPTRPAPRELLSQWIRTAEKQAGLSKLDGGLTHPYRRKWRSERSRHPIKAVAVAGGWTDVETMTRCYDMPDEADVLAVTSEPRKRSEAVSSCSVAAIA